MSTKRWKRLSPEQLGGAYFALQVVQSWPRVNGQVLKGIHDFIEEVMEEMKVRGGTIPKSEVEP